MGRMLNDCMHGKRNVGYGGSHERSKGNGNVISQDENKHEKSIITKENNKKETEWNEYRMKLMKRRIEEAWNTYYGLQEQYRQLTGKPHEWLK